MKKVFLSVLLVCCLQLIPAQQAPELNHPGPKFWASDGMLSGFAATKRWYT